MNIQLCDSSSVYLFLSDCCLGIISMRKWICLNNWVNGSLNMHFCMGIEICQIYYFEVEVEAELGKDSLGRDIFCVKTSQKHPSVTRRWKIMSLHSLTLEMSTLEIRMLYIHICVYLWSTSETREIIINKIAEYQASLMSKTWIYDLICPLCSTLTLNMYKYEYILF